MKNLKLFFFLLLYLCFNSITILYSSCSSFCSSSPCFELGVDVLYWTPCISDQNFALVDAEEPIKTTMMSSDWGAGVRVYLNTEDIGNGFSGSLAYTYIRPEASGSLTSNLENTIAFSSSLPVSTGSGDNMRAAWKAEYQSADLLIARPIKMTHFQCFKTELFVGLTWLDVEQNRIDSLFSNTDTNAEESFTLHRHNEFWGVGPIVGLRSTFEICGCFHFFGAVKASAALGKSESIDTLSITTQGELNLENVYLAKDKCSCFSGLHLLAGIGYDFCLGDANTGIRLGWECLQWVNSPAFPSYQQDGEGIRSASSTHTFSMQGIFVGLNAAF